MLDAHTASKPHQAHHTHQMHSWVGCSRPKLDLRVPMGLRGPFPRELVEARYGAQSTREEAAGMAAAQRGARAEDDEALAHNLGCNPGKFQLGSPAELSS